LAMS